MIDNLPVKQMDNPISVSRIMLGVGYHHNSRAFRIQLT